MTRRWRTEYGQYVPGEEPEWWDEWKQDEIARVRTWQREHPGYRRRADTSIPVMPDNIRSALDAWIKMALIIIRDSTCEYIALQDLYLSAYRTLQRLGIELDQHIQDRGLAKYLRSLGAVSVRHDGKTVFNNIHMR
jgi:hypothetical protein